MMVICRFCEIEFGQLEPRVWIGGADYAHHDCWAAVPKSQREDYARRAIEDALQNEPKG